MALNVEATIHIVWVGEERVIGIRRNCAVAAKRESVVNAQDHLGLLIELVRSVYLPGKEREDGVR